MAKSEDVVVWSIIIDPGFKKSIAPSCPQIISLTSLSLPTHKISISELLDISLIELYEVPEKFFFHFSLFECDLLNTETSKIFDKCHAIGKPMTPRPIKPMVSFIQ